MATLSLGAWCLESRTFMARTPSFSTTLKKFRNETVNTIGSVHANSVADVIEDAQLPRELGGRMRIRTGFLRSSLHVAIKGHFTVAGPEVHKDLRVLLRPKDSIRAYWTAYYAGFREFGTYNQTPDFFMRGAVAKFRSFVAENARKYGRS